MMTKFKYLFLSLTLSICLSSYLSSPTVYAAESEELSEAITVDDSGDTVTSTGDGSDDETSVDTQTFDFTVLTDIQWLLIYLNFGIFILLFLGKIGGEKL